MANQAAAYGPMIGNQKMRGGPGQVLLHSLSTNDASVGEYKFTVNVGHHQIKITGDSFDLVRVSAANFRIRLKTSAAIKFTIKIVCKL